MLAARAGLETLVVHVDHGLRPGSAAEVQLVAAVAARYGSRFEARSVTVPPGPDLEARGRFARYQVLPAGVLTGHTMDDQAETVLLAVLRGAALDGLAGMRPGSRTGWPGGPRRPLLAIRRSETAALCAAEGLTPFQDPTNDETRFRRNRVRAEVLPLLCDGREPRSGPGPGPPGEPAGRGRRLARSDVGDRRDATDVKAVRAAPAPLARRAVRRWLRNAGAGADGETHPPSAGEVARVLAVAGGDARACELAGGRRVERHGGRLSVAAR